MRLRACTCSRGSGVLRGLWALTKYLPHATHSRCAQRGRGAFCVDRSLESSEAEPSRRGSLRRLHFTWCSSSGSERLAEGAGVCPQPHSP